MPHFAPGDAVASRCTRCDDVTGHVIVALVGGEIIKVECRACGSVHKYRPPEGKAVDRPDSPRRVRQGANRSEVIKAAQTERAAREKRVAGSTSKPAGGVRAARAAEATENAWKAAMSGRSAAKPYSMNALFERDDVVDHPTFGAGVVQELVPPDKVRILFQDGLRLLRCAG